MAISQCLADPRTLMQSVHCLTGTKLSRTAWYLAALFWAGILQDPTSCLGSECQVIYVSSCLCPLSIVSVSTSVPCCHAYTRHLVIPSLCELQHSNESIFVVFLPLRFWKICYAICYICKGKWVKNKFKMITLEKFRCTLDCVKTRVGSHWAMWSYHFLPLILTGLKLLVLWL